MIIFYPKFSKKVTPDRHHQQSGRGTIDDVESRGEDERPEFRGELRTSPVTGKQERYYPQARRYPSYLLSVVVTSSFLAVAFGIMILSLNLQGYIKDEGAADGSHTQLCVICTFMV